MAPRTIWKTDLTFSFGGLRVSWGCEIHYTEKSYGIVLNYSFMPALLDLPLTLILATLLAAYVSKSTALLAVNPSRTSFSI
jgi:hypothetical protein